MNNSRVPAHGLFLVGIMLWLCSTAGAQQGPAWTDAQCRARYNQLMEMMRKASDPKTSLSELKKAIDDSRSLFAKYCPMEAPSLKYLTRSVEDIEADRQETAAADIRTGKAGIKMENFSSQNPSYDAGYISFGKGMGM